MSHSLEPPLLQSLSFSYLFFPLQVDCLVEPGSLARQQADRFVHFISHATCIRAIVYRSPLISLPRWLPFVHCALSPSPWLKVAEDKQAPEMRSFDYYQQERRACWLCV